MPLIPLFKRHKEFVLSTFGSMCIETLLFYCLLTTYLISGKEGASKQSVFENIMQAAKHPESGTRQK